MNDLMISQFIDDYLSLNFEQLIDKYVKTNSPSLVELMNYIQRNQIPLDLFVDSEPTPSDRFYFLVKRASGYQVYNLFRGMPVMETDYIDLNKAVQGKLFRVTESIAASKRG